MRLEKRNELKEYTWKAMRFSAISEPAAQAAAASGPIRVVLGPLVGYHASPRKSAKEKREFTLTMPSRAIMWMVVVVTLRCEKDKSDICDGEEVGEMGEEEETFFFGCFFKAELVLFCFVAQLRSGVKVRTFRIAAWRVFSG